MPANLRLLGAIINALDDAIVAMSPEGVITHWNSAAERMFGYTADEAIGQHGRMILPKAWWGFWHERLAELQRGATVVCESVRRHKDGTPVDVHATTSGVFSAQGEFLGYFNIFKDLRLKNEQDLANAFLAAIVRSSPDAIFSTDIDFRIRSWNAAARTLLGRTSDEVLGQPVDRIVPEIAAQLHCDEQSATAIRRFEALLSDNRGQQRVVSAVASPLLNSAGVPTGWSVSCTDITDRRKLEQHNRFVMRELSHRAKNLLAVISSMARSTADSRRSFTEFEADFSARLRGLAKSHDLLVGEEWRGASLHQLIRNQLRSFVGSGWERVAISGPDVMLCPAATQCLGLAFHELGTNAVKYGALASQAGHIAISSSRIAGGYELIWTESGGPAVMTKPAAPGFGSVVIEDMVAETLGREAQIEYRPDGIVWSATVPNSMIVEAGSPALGPESLRRAS
jgi:two-component system CheB/CheR fusion protein